MRLDGVEIKANVDEVDLDEVEKVLKVGDERRLSIYFYEDTTPGQSQPLLDAGVVIRVRVDEGGDDGDCTVKLRPCRRSQLFGDWVDPPPPPDEDKVELRYEEDWSGSRKVLAVSCEADLKRKDIEAVEDTAGLPDGLLVELQERLLTECAVLKINLSQLTRLGPIEATKWAEEGAAGLAEARVERWRVANLDFLEVSIKPEDGNPERAQQGLHDALAALGVTVSSTQQNKTEQVLAALSG